MTDSDTNEATMTAALRQFGWTCGPEFWERYYLDPWVFNLANAVERLVATVEQARSQRDEARRTAEAIEAGASIISDQRDALRADLVQARSQRDAALVELADARTAIRWLRDGDEPIDVVAVSEAIRRARATTELTALGEPDIDHYRSDWRDVVRPPQATTEETSHDWYCSTRGHRSQGPCDCTMTGQGRTAVPGAETGEPDHE